METLYPVLAAIATYGLLVSLSSQGRIMPVASASMIGFAALFAVAYVIANHFTGKGIDDSVFFHLQHALSPKVLVQFYQWVLLCAGALGVIIVGVWWAVKRQFKFSLQKRKRSPVADLLLNTLGFGCASFALVVHPAVHDTYTIFHERYMLRGEDKLAQLLRESQDVIVPLNPKSFVYLYIESLDQVFFDEERFPGLVSGLSQLFSEGQRIGGLYQAPMTGWTMSGMVASQCGLPLARMASHTSFSSEQPRETVCLGDVLSGHGYHLTFMGGADTTFAGKGSFYRNHGFDEVRGAEELDVLAGRRHERSIWGVYDDDLFSLAFEQFEAIASAEQRFGMVLLTLDTHPPHGHETPSCEGLRYGDGSSGILNSVHCADKIITQFIRGLLASPYAQDIVLIVSSDHVMMGNDADIQRDKGGRQNTYVYFNSNLSSPDGRLGTMLDVAPTTLHLLGFEVQSMGFGRNLFLNQPTLVEEYGADEFYRLILVWRNQLMKVWSAITEKEVAAN